MILKTTRYFETSTKRNKYSIFILSRIFNLSFSSGTYPEKLRISGLKTTPIFKKGSRMSVLLCENIKELVIIDRYLFFLI